MKARYNFYWIITILMFVLTLISTACGTTNQANAGTTGSNVNTTAGETPEAQSTPTDTGTKIAVIATTTPVTSVASNLQNEVKVNLNDTAITSSLQTFSKGVPYSFVIANTGKSPHDFIITQQAQNTASTSPTLELIIVPATQLAPGATRLLTYTFAPSTASLQLVFTEHLAGSGGQGSATPQLSIQVK